MKENVVIKIIGAVASKAGPPTEEFGHITEVTETIEERKRRKLGTWY